MKILLFGRNGQVGWELQRSLAPLGEVIALSSRREDNPKVNGCPLQGDFMHQVGLVETVQTVRPDIIVNAAAHTAVDKAETDESSARQINAVSVRILAQEAQRIGAVLVHYSTDYVFDGSGEKPWREDDRPNPLNIYGQTKLEGEMAVVKYCERHLIFRTSWVYAARGGNFAKTMLRLGGEREVLKVIGDQYGAPTGADLIADVTAHAARSLINDPSLAGLYNLAAGGETTWHGYATHVLTRAREAGIHLKVTPGAIDSVPTSSFATAAVRPLNSRLNTLKLQKCFGLSLPRWDSGLDRTLTEIFLSHLTKS